MENLKKKAIRLKVMVATLAIMVTSVVPTLITKADTEIPAPGLHLRITAYSSSVDETDSTPFITASGLHVADGIAASNLLPMGTKIRIPDLFGNKVFTIEDRMSPRFSKTIDIWMPTKAKALYFGMHYADVVVVGGPEITLK